MEFAKNLIATQLALIDISEAEFCSSVEILLSKKQLLCAGQAIQAGLLSISKAMSCLEETELALHRLKELHKARDLD